MGIGSLGTWELVVILLIVVLLFGGSRIPALAAAVGSTIKQFKKGLTDPGPRAPNDD
jgi:sec-independent protein translocase protein TatA